MSLRPEPPPSSPHGYPGGQLGRWQEAFSGALFGRQASFQPASPKLQAARLKWERPVSLPGIRTIVWAAALLAFLLWAWVGIKADPVTLFTDLRNSTRIINQFMDPDWSVLRQGIEATIETVQMAVIGILVAAVLAIPLGLLAARNVAHPAVYYATRSALSFMRCIPELVWAIIFVIVVGLGPWAGTLAIIFGTAGSFGKLFAECIESIDPRPVDAVRSTGANAVSVSIFAVLPQAFPLMLSYMLYYWESTVRHATVLGLVGAGGIGVYINAAIGVLRYDKLIVYIMCIFVAVLVIDRISALVRARLI